MELPELELRKRPACWDLRDELPEEQPVVTYRLSPEEVARRYGPPRPRPAATGMAGVAYGCAPPMQPMTRDVLQALAAQGLTVKEIAERLERPQQAVRYRARLWGIAIAGEEQVGP